MDRRRTMLAAAFAFVFVAVGVLLLGDRNVIAAAVGVLSLAFFGIGLLVLLVAIATPPLVVAFSEDGVRFGGLLPNMRFEVPWEAIRSVRIYRYMAAVGPGTRMLGFVPADPDAPVWRRRLARMNGRLTGVPVSIAANTVGGELEQLVARMRIFHPSLELEYGTGQPAAFKNTPGPQHRSP